MKKIINITAKNYGERLDIALNQYLPQCSRAQIQKLINNGKVLIDDKIKTPAYKCLGNEKIALEFEPPANLEDSPQNLPINIVFEDEEILVINKPAGLTVHPGNGQKDNTLLNRLLFHRPQLKNIARAGIVHRLDKDTSGLMVIAKTDFARQFLISEISTRQVSREYLALCMGKIKTEGTINANIIRHPNLRTQMAVSEDFKNITNKNLGKEAITHYRVINTFNNAKDHYNLVHCRLESGRTHQIRVHLSYIGAPIIGDKTYNRNKVYEKLAKIATRQLLHAFYLKLSHPQTKMQMCWQVDIPEDFNNAILFVKELVNVS